MLCHRKDLEVEGDLGFARDKLSFITTSPPHVSTVYSSSLLFPHSFLPFSNTYVFCVLVPTEMKVTTHIGLHEGNIWKVKRL